MPADTKRRAHPAARNENRPIKIAKRRNEKGACRCSIRGRYPQREQRGKQDDSEKRRSSSKQAGFEGSLSTSPVDQAWPRDCASQGVDHTGGDG
jgi:hypothetical protein